MKDFITDVCDIYDVVLIDSPPVIAVTDAQIIATYVDGVVLVVAAGQVERDVVIKAKEKFAKVKANILGVALTKVPTGKKGYGYNYNNYYYYGTEENTINKKNKKRNKSSWI